MKNLKLIVFLVSALLLMPISANAASCSIKVSGASTAVVGNTVTVNVTLSSSSALGSWEFLINYDTSYLKLTSSTTESGGTSSAGYASNSSTKSKTYTFKFQALKSGSTSVKVGSYLVYGFDEAQMSVSASSATIKIMTQAELEATYSKDNNLKNLEVEGYTLTPEFDKDTLEYTLKVPSTVTSVNIKATKNDSTATISGDGEHEVTEGVNSFEIVVRAQNGTEKTYKLNIEVEDLNPITLTINNKEYSIVKRKDSLEKPASYEETTTTINEVEVPAFYSDTTKFTLVGIKDSDGTISLAIYNQEDNSYTIYNEFTTNALTLYLTSFPEALKGYIKDTITINGVEVEVYRYKDNSRFVVCYGMNIETGEYNYYSYDTLEGNYQVWNEEEITDLQKSTKTYLYTCIAFGVCLLVSFILIINLLKTKKKKKKDKIINKENPKEIKKEEPKQEEKVIENNEDMKELIDDLKSNKKRQK